MLPQEAEILITGGAGFIGSHLRSIYPRADILDRAPRKTRNGRFLEDDIRKYIHADIRDEADMKGILPKYDYVFHLAGLISSPDSINDPARYWQVNVDGTAVVCRHAKQVYFASSASVYDPLTPYALTKRVAERTVLQSGGSVGRFYNVFGEGQTQGVIPMFIEAALQNKPLSIYGCGSQTRDFIYVKDLVAEFNFDNLIKDIGYGYATTVLDLAEKIKELCNSDSVILYQPNRDGDIGHSFSPTPLVGEYGFIEGLKRTIKWMITK